MYPSEFESTLNGNKILQKHRNLLKTLSDDRAMCVGYKEEGIFYILECCDEWFSHDLTKEECIELSKMFKKIAKEIGKLKG
jgi:hypothetical protein